MQPNHTKPNEPTDENQVASVSKPRGDSFEDARMTRDEVDAALQKGTVIFSAAGAHIPKLAAATLACTDASSLPCALNMYVTAPGRRTSAPPHTDRQDVIVVQTQGRKRWRVYGPPDPALEPDADMFARGKGDDDLPLYALVEGRFGSDLLLDVTLRPGDVLFVPAAFPHTTDTVDKDDDGKENELSGGGKVKDSTSIHLTFNFETHVWDMDYLSARRLALRRAGVTDWALGQFGDAENRYIGRANELPPDVRAELFRTLPLGLLDDDNDDDDGGGGGSTAASSSSSSLVQHVASELRRISYAVDEETAAQVPDIVWTDTVEAIRSQGRDLMDVHRDMYGAAIEEGRVRRSEEAMTAHLSGEALAKARARAVTMPERIQRLSVFRVREYYSKINDIKDALVAWSKAGPSISSKVGGGERDGTGAVDDGDAAFSSSSSSPLPDDWEFSLPLQIGDQVEADLGGAFFPATVTEIGGSEGPYGVRFFDGDVMDGLSRDMIKLSAPPPEAGGGGEQGGDPPPGLTKKELKRWRKRQEKGKKK